MPNDIMIKFVLICLISIVTADTNTDQVEVNVNSSDTSLRSLSKSIYIIKYLTELTEYPVKLVDNTGGSDSNWYKYGSKAYVDQIDSYKEYFSFEKHPANDLVLNKFDKKYALLDHYEVLTSSPDDYYELESKSSKLV